MYTKKLYFDAENHLPLSDLRYVQYPLRRGQKRAKNRRLSPDFVRDAMDICRIANRKTGGNFTDDFAFISYTALFSVTNSCQPSWQHNFGFFGRKNVLSNLKMRSQLSFQPLMSEQSDVYKNYAKSPVDSPPVIRIAMRQLPVSSRVKTYQKPRFYARFWPRCDRYLSYRKLEKRRWFFASKGNFFVYITSVWHKYPYT